MQYPLEAVISKVWFLIPSITALDAHQYIQFYLPQKCALQFFETALRDIDVLGSDKKTRISVSKSCQRMASTTGFVRPLKARRSSGELEASLWAKQLVLVD